MGAFAFSTGTSGGGGGSPGGTSLQLQFNNAGSFGGVAGLEYNSTNNAIDALTGLSGGYRLFNTVDRTVNFERARIWWDGNIFKIDTSAGGTGNNRAIRLINADNIAFGLNTIGSGSGNLEFSAGSTGITNAVGFRSTFTSTASSGTPFHVELAPTINQSGTAGYTALRINVTETATGSGAKRLIDVGIGGASSFRVLNDGVIGYAAANTSTTVGGAGGAAALPAAPVGYFLFETGGTYYKVPYFFF